MESKKNEKARGSIVTKVSLMTTILFVCLIVNVIASVAIQYTQIRNNVEQMLTENLSSSSVLVSNGMNNLNILVNDHSYDYQFIAGSAEDKKSHADMVASFDERVFGLTYIAADGRQYGEGVDESIKSAVFSAGKLLTTPTGEDGDFYYGLKNDMGALVSHMKAEKLATFLEGSTCDAFILSKDGTVIASHAHSGAYEKTYPNYVQSEGQIYVNTNTGGNFMNGYCYAAASIDNTDGWTVLIRAQAGQFYSGIVSAFWVNIVLVVVMSGLGAMTVLLMKKSIITPIKTIRKKIVDMSMGNISGGTVDITSNDELGELAEAVNRMTKTNEEMIVDIQHTAEQIAACNLAVQPKAEYNGDFIPIKNALESIIESLNEVVANVEAAASEVKSSSVQMSSNSSALSEAAREESQIVDELNSSLSDVHQQIKASAQKASEAREVGEQSVQAMNEGNEKMNNMLAAMEEINETSSQIANIIKTIQDISFQTNILSLNASIEAARAGTAGKGFAVVANEVGALANKTAEAAKSTTDLIETALKAVKHGTVSANETAEMLASVVEKMANSADSINQIADASVEQAQSIINVVEGVNRIAHSVEHVNISAAECASSSDVLSRESAMLYSTIENFVTDKKFERKEKKSAASAVEQNPAQPAKAPEVKPTQKPKVITLDENEEKEAAASDVAAPKAEAAPRAEAAPKATAPKAVAPKAVAPKAETVHKPVPKAKAAPTIKLEESEETPSKPQPAVSKATMAPVKHTVHLDDDKY